MYSVEDIIKWFLNKEGMTPKKLQKMLYYAYSWYLTLNNEPNEDNDVTYNRLFNEKFQAWVHGPVIPRIYGEYKHKRYNEIEQVDEVISLDEDTENLLKQVWDVYGGYTGNELESISHQETPWIEARDGCDTFESCKVELNDTTILNYYGKRKTA